MGSGKTSIAGGSGAGHGTPGGDGAVVSGGEEVGSVYEPILPGARGGAGIGGAVGSRGGGRVRVVVGFAFRLDGIVNVDAVNAMASSGWSSSLRRYLFCCANFLSSKYSK